MAAIVWFQDLRKEDIPKAGGKGANLGELISAGLPVPPGFALSADSYTQFLETTNLTEDIYELLKELDVNDTEKLNEVSQAIKNMITGSKIPKDIADELKEAYKKLSEGIIRIAGQPSGEFVAVRSSATAEDLPDASFAGQQETLLNVRGEEELLKAVKECWASLFTSRAIFYRVEKGFEHEKVAISVLIQKMIDSEKSGVTFTVNPVNNNEREIIIEAVWGLGEGIVSGQITPDNYVIDKESLAVLRKNVTEKSFMYTRDLKTGKTVKANLNEDRAKMQVLNQEELKQLADYAKKIESHYNFPQDIEWAVEEDIIYILQSRPITTLKRPEKTEYEGIESVIEAESTESREEPPIPVSGEEAQVLTKGFGASPGVAAGKVKLIHDTSELSKIQKGNILVTKMTTPDMVPAMERASAIVTNEGGTTCHAAIVSRELGIPCIVGTRNATEVLKEDQEITVDAVCGVVNPGIIQSKIEKEKREEVDLGEVPETKTKVYVNLGVPSRAEEIAKLPVDGVGLMREEFIFASKIGEHPLDLIARGEEHKFVDTLAEGIAQVARAFNPRPVVLRLSDFKTNEYRSLKGGEKYEEEEANPMIGWRGCSRYTSEKYAPAFKLELKAVKKVRDEEGLKNVWIMLPFVRNLKDVTQVVKLMEEEGLQKGPDLKIWMMAEVPSNILLADEFAKLVDGFSIGSNDLTQLIMGADRDSELLMKLGYFDERDLAVKRAIAHLIAVAHKAGKTVSICGQAPSVYPDFTEFLVGQGIDSISANPDVAVKTRRIIAEAESKLGEKKSEEIGKLELGESESASVPQDKESDQ